MDIKSIVSKEPFGEEIEVKGWVRTFRSNRFIAYVKELASGYRF
jgi:aspartyl/asparaginyl-tRNA synthetase